MTLISVRGLVVMIVACQVMDPGSISGERNFFLIVVWSTTNKIVRAMPMPLSRLAPKASALTTRPIAQRVIPRKKESQAGLEPAISASGGQRLIH